MILLIRRHSPRRRVTWSMCRRFFLVGGPEYVGDEVELAGRDQALAQAARENRKRRARYGGGNWAVVVEVGGVVPGSLHTNTQFAGEVGVQAERRSVAVRMVRPHAG